MNLPESGTNEARRLARGNERMPIQTIVLRTLYAAGMIGTALVAPNMLRIFPSLDPGKHKREELYGRIDQALYRLHKKKLITFVPTDGRRPLAGLTKRGKAEIEKIVLGQYRITPMPVWDGKWRMVIFDIREKRRGVRQRLRCMLAGAGFVRLQDSVWVVPFPCDEFIQLMRAYFASGTGELLYFTADGLEADHRLRDRFNLS
jgi:hypothetical protein